MLREQLTSGNIALLVIDGTIGVLGVRDANDYAEAYRRMGPLAALAREADIGVIAIRHVRKSDGDAISRGMGSVGYAALARSIIVVAVDRDNPERRFFAHAKCNVGEIGPTLVFSINGVVLPDFESSIGCAEWIGPVEVTADEAMSVRLPEERDERNAADGWLSHALAQGARHAEELVREAKREGISRAALYRSARRLKVVMRLEGFPAKSTWSPPPVVSGVSAISGVSPQNPPETRETSEGEGQASHRRITAFGGDTSEMPETARQGDRGVPMPQSRVLVPPVSESDALDGEAFL